MKKIGLLVVAVALFVSCTASAVIEPVQRCRLPSLRVPVLMALSAKRSMIATVGEGGSTINIFDVRTGSLIRTLRADGIVTNLAFSTHDSARNIMLAVTTNRNYITVWNIDNSDELPLINWHIDSAATAIAFSPRIKEGMILAVATKNNDITTWNINIRTMIDVWHIGRVINRLAFSWNRDGVVICATGVEGDPIVDIYSICGVFMHRLDVGNPITNLAFYPHLNDFILAVVTRKAFPRVDVSGCPAVNGYGCPHSYGYGNQQVMDYKMGFWNVETGKYLQTQTVDVPTKDMIFTPQYRRGLFLAAPAPDNVVQVYLARVPQIDMHGEYGCPPVYGEYGCPLMHDYGCAPVHDYGCPMYHDYGCQPYHAYGCPVYHGYGCAPVHDYGYHACPPVQHFAPYGCL